MICLCGSGICITDSTLVSRVTKITPKNHADYAAATALDAGAADDDGRNSRQQVWIAHRLVRLIRVAREKHPSQRKACTFQRRRTPAS